MATKDIEAERDESTFLQETSQDLPLPIFVTRHTLGELLSELPTETATSGESRGVSGGQ